MEDLLASIRKAIHEDIGEVPAAMSRTSMSSQSAGTLYKSGLRELHVKVGDEVDSAAAEIQELRERINRTRLSEMQRDATPPRTGFAGQLAAEVEARPSWRTPEPAAPPLRQSYAEQDLRRLDASRNEFTRRPPPRDYTEPPQAAWSEEPAYQPAPEPQPRYRPEPAMLSHDSASAAGAAFSKLADSILNRATGDRSIEDMTRDLLRGMLKQWLDDNLPSLVERLVREEIERVARRGR